MRDAYNALECGMVFYLAETDLPSSSIQTIAVLTALSEALPTHSVRSETQIALQQFSTPAPIA